MKRPVLWNALYYETPCIMKRPVLWNVCCLLLTDVSGQPICPIIQRPTLQEDTSRNLGKQKAT